MLHIVKIIQDKMIAFVAVNEVIGAVALSLPCGSWPVFQTETKLSNDCL